MWNAPVGAGESPPNVRVTDVHSSNLTIEWDGFSKCRFINGRITKYKVLYSAKPNGTIQSAYKNKDIYHTWDTGRIISLVGLSPYTNYSIQVAAVNILENEGKYSDPIRAQTAEDGTYMALHVIGNTLELYSLSFLLSSFPAPGPVVIASFPSFFNITITWEEPSMPNGIITHYEVYYGRPAGYPPSVVNTTNTSFTTPDHLEPGTEMIFTVKAYTKVGEGEATTTAVFTFIRPCEFLCCPRFKM